jgi:DNA-binding SARP family transcriptional activator
MRFRVLGPLEVDTDGGPIALGGQKERLLLALLLARPNQVVPVETLVRGLWGERPPRSAGKTLQSHVVRLRRALEPGRARGAAGEVLVTREPGYLVRVAPGALDAERFEELTAQARCALAAGAADAAESMLREALGLWRGQAFEEFLDTDFGAAEADRLAELRLVALEDRNEADLRLGRHRELVAELEGLVREHPLRERLWAQLLIALYRAGRQADALLAYQRARSILVEELGIDPGAELRRLQAAVLAQDPGLDLPPTAEAAAARELPEALRIVGPAFVGRADELRWLRAAWREAIHGRGGVVFLIGGQGMGKTRLAAEFAREVHDRGGWVLYGPCTPPPHGPLQPFAQALAGWDTSRRDMPAPDPERSPAVFGQELAGLLAGRPDRAVLLALDDLHLAEMPALEALAGLAAAAATRRLLVLGAYQDEEATPKLTALIQQLDSSGTGRRRLGPLGRDEVVQVLALYESEQAARATADTVVERTGGVPLLVTRALGDWTQAQAAHQVEETAGQIASSPSHLHMVQAKPADDVTDLRELNDHSQQVARLATGQGPAGQEPNDRPVAAVCPYKGLAHDYLYDHPPVGARQRPGRLARNLGGYRPQPDEQLAAVYRRTGRDQDARRFAIAKHRARRRTLGLPGRVWSLLLDGLVGYGYRTWLAGVWLVGWWLAGWVVFDRAHTRHDLVLAQPGEPHPSFQGAVYALDNVLPAVDLGQQAVWIPRGGAQWWACASVLAGWVLTIAVVAAVTGLLKRD